MGGGGGGGKPKKETPPPQAQPIDYGKMMAESSEQAKAQYRDQVAAQIEAYPTLEALQLGTIGKLSDRLSANNNAYTRRATDQLLAAEDQATQLGTIGDYTEQLGYTAAQDLEGTDIERELGSQALRELQLGRALSPEQQRQATQQARAGMSARGLGVGNAALAAEILNRDSYASQREAERRNFAGSTNQMLVGNRQNRIGMVGNILGQSANTRMNQANLRSSLAGANITIDPYARAMNPALGMGASTLGNSGQMIANTYNTATQMAGNVASFNANMLDSRYNSFMNNRAYLQGAGLYGGAAGAAGNSAMGAGIGTMVGAGIGTMVAPGVGTMVGASLGGAGGSMFCWVARAAWGADNPRWREFRDSMLAHAPDWFLGAYARHGERLARHIHTPTRRALARLVLSTLQKLWTPAKSTLQPA
jgi:hypothetical protein